MANSSGTINPKMMRFLFHKLTHWTFAFLLVWAVGCGTQEEHSTGDDPGEANRENSTLEKQDETGNGFTREHNDGSDDAEVGPSPGADSTTTDSTQVTPRMGR